MAAREGVAALHSEIDALLDHAEALGMRLPDLAALVNARLTLPLCGGAAGFGGDGRAVPGGDPRLCPRHRRASSGDAATVQPVTLDQLQSDAARPATSPLRPIWWSPSTPCTPELAALLPNSTVAAIRFIPSEDTRRALAALDPLARLGVVSRFAEFLPIMRSGVQRFAPHVEDLVAIDCADPGAAAALAGCGTVIVATGVDAGRTAAGDGADDRIPAHPRSGRCRPAGETLRRPDLAAAQPGEDAT